MSVFKCKMCGGALEISEGMKICECEYCGTTQTVPSQKDENIQALFNRANILRMKSEFDKAEQLYEKIIQNAPEEPEAHWGLILCKFGIEYVEDPATFKRVPTCHRTSFDSIIADDDYKEALRCADSIQRDIYEREAKEIDRIQKEILALSAKEEPYDVFICYKENDNGSRTPDSVIANDIYYQLTNEGFKVFYAAITLENKLGSAYEPCIFAALNSAKVMLAIGTKPEYFNAVWVKNEWSRYLKMIKKDRSKLLIPCYKDMDAYELPEEFAHLQAQDMSKIGFINDIVRGIKKVIVKDEPKKNVIQVQNAASASVSAPVSSLLKRVFIFLEDGDWKSANEYCEKALDLDPENGEAYLGKLMAELKIKEREELKYYPQPFDKNRNYLKIMKYGVTSLKTEMEGYQAEYYQRAELLKHFIAVVKRMEKQKKEEMKQRKLQMEKDRELQQKENTYIKAGELYRDGKYADAIGTYATIADYKDSFEIIKSVLLESQKKIDSVKEIEDKNSKMRVEYRSINTQIREIGFQIQSFQIVQQKLADARNEYDQTNMRVRSLQNELSSLGIFAGAKKKQIKEEINSREARMRELSSIIASLQNGAYCDVNASEQEINRLQSRLNELQAQIDKNQNEIDETKVQLPEVETTDYGILIKKMLIASENGLSKTEELRGFIKNNGIEVLLLTDTITEISNESFKDCTSMTSITIPDSVTSIGDCAFWACKRLTSVTIPDSVTSIGNHAFWYCTSLTSITIPNSVTSIGNEAFEDCTNLTSVNIPDSVTSIGWRAFKGCTNLTSVTIPDSVTGIGNHAFQGCTSLTSITIPDSVTKIGWDAFYGCTSLTSVTIPDSVTSIEDHAFEGCTSLTSVRLPKNVKIGTDAFKNTKVKL